MEKHAFRRSSMLRGLGVITALLIAAGAISPAFGAAPLTKARVKKIAKKQATRVVKTLGPMLFTEETELVRFGQISMNVGDADQSLGTFGPFTLRLACNLDAGDVRGQVLATTTEANSSLNSNDDSDGDFNPGEALEWAAEVGDVPGGASDPAWHDDTTTASAPGGTSLYGHTAVTTNFGGSHCVFSGHVVVQAPA